jgi:hypothetical protein
MKGQRRPLRRPFSAFFGRPLKISEGHTQKVGPFRGIPILGLDALGSASYGPEAALTVLIPLGAIGLGYVRGVVAAILVLLAILYFSYRQTIAAYPNGGGSYTVAKENLGQATGLIAAASLMLDYLLNVAVAISAGVGALESAFPSLQTHRLPLCLLVLSIVTLVNLRGVRESGLAWALPTYLFVATLLAVIAVGVWKSIATNGRPVPVAVPPPLAAATVPVSVWLIMRSFASGCTAMTGQFSQTFPQTHSRFVAENLPCSRNVCKTIADVANTAFFNDFRLDLLFTKSVRHVLCDFENGVVVATADVEYFSGGLDNFQCETACLRNIAHVNKIAALLAMLVHKRWIVV